LQDEVLRVDYVCRAESIIEHWQKDLNNHVDQEARPFFFPNRILYGNDLFYGDNRR
jgi:hypothetical protein